MAIQLKDEKDGTGTMTGLNLKKKGERPLSSSGKNVLIESFNEKIVYNGEIVTIAVNIYTKA